MGYFDQVAMDDSNRALRDRFAATPVVPNAGPAPTMSDDTAGARAATTPRSAGPISTYATDLSGGLVDTTPPAAPREGPISMAAYGPDVLGGNTFSRELPAAPLNAGVDQSLKKPRTSAYGLPDEPYGGPDNNRGSSALATAAAALPTGPISTMGRSGVLPAGITRDGSSYTGVGDAAPAPGMTTDQANAYYGGIRQAGDVLDRQTLAERAAAAQREAATPNSRDIERAQSEARVATFRATSGADAILAGRTFGGRSPEREALAAQAAGANANVAAMRGQAAANAAAPTRNYIDEFAKSQEASVGGAKAGQALQTGAVDLQGKQLDVKAKQRIDTIGAQLATETDPKKIQELHSSMLALLGKDKPEDYQVIHAPGASHVDPTTMAVTKDPDSVVIMNKRNGQAQVLTLGSQGSAKNYPVPGATSIALLKSDPSKRAAFDNQFGPGASSKVLGN